MLRKCYVNSKNKRKTPILKELYTNGAENRILFDSFFEYFQLFDFL